MAKPRINPPLSGSTAACKHSQVIEFDLGHLSLNSNCARLMSNLTPSKSPSLIGDEATCVRCCQASTGNAMQTLKILWNHLQYLTTGAHSCCHSSCFTQAEGLRWVNPVIRFIPVSSHSLLAMSGQVGTWFHTAPSIHSPRTCPRNPSNQ